MQTSNKYTCRLSPSMAEIKSFSISFKMILNLSEKKLNKIKASDAWVVIQFLCQQFIEC